MDSRIVLGRGGRQPAGQDDSVGPLCAESGSDDQGRAREDTEGFQQLDH